MEKLKNYEELKTGVEYIAPVEQQLWVHLRAASRYWQSDLEFYKEEIAFFRALTEKHLKVLISQKHIDETRNLVLLLDGLEKYRRSIADKNKRHLLQINELFEDDSFVRNMRMLKADHEILEKEFLKFVNQYRYIKRDIFSLIEVSCTP